MSIAVLSRGDVCRSEVSCPAKQSAACLSWPSPRYPHEAIIVRLGSLDCRMALDAEDLHRALWRGQFVLRVAISSCRSSAAVESATPPWRRPELTQYGNGNCLARRAV
jgi:hypothetical protein